MTLNFISRKLIIDIECFADDCHSISIFINRFQTMENLVFEVNSDEFWMSKAIEQALKAEKYW